MSLQYVTAAGILSGAASNIGAYSLDAITWTQGGNLPSTHDWQFLAFGNGIVVAVARDPSTTAAYTSNGGTSWNASNTLPDTTDYMNALAFGNGIFVAVINVTATQAVMSSTDGITWTKRTLTGTGGTFGWQTVAFGNGVFMAYAGDGTVNTSSDGINWSSPGAGPVATTSNQVMVFYGNGTWLVNCPNLNNTYTSTNNGASWTTHTNAVSAWASSGYGYMAWNGSIFLMACGSSTSPLVTSPDGVTWTARTNAGVTGMSVANGIFFLGSMASGTTMRTTTDGITINTRTMPASVWWSGGVAYISTQTYNVSLSESGAMAETVTGPLSFVAAFNEFLGGRNLLLQTNSWASPWFYNDCAVTPGQADPFGGTNAALITAVASPTNTFWGQNGSMQLANTSKTYSTYLKAGTFVLEQYFMWMRDGAQNNIAYTIFDLANGVISSVFLGSATMTRLPGGWWRCTITGIFPGNATAGWYCYVDPSGTGAANETYYNYGNQFEDGSVATNYAANGASPSSGLDSVQGQSIDTGTLSEAGSAADSMTSTFADVGFLNEVTGGVDTTSALLRDVGTVTEAFAGADTVAATGVEGVAISEAGAAIDTPFIAVGGFLTEAGSMSDSMTFLPIFPRTVPEAFAGVDTVSGVNSTNTTVIEAGAAADTVTGPLTGAGTLSEAMAAVATHGATGAEAVALTEAMAALDTVMHGYNYALDIADAGAGLDTVVGNRATSDSILDAGAAIDTMFFSLGGSLAEAFIGADDYELQATFERDTVEAVNTVDFVGAKQGYNIVEAFVGADTVAATGTEEADVNEQNPLVELFDGGLTTEGDTAESSPPSDIVVGSFTPSVLLTESMNAQDVMTFIASDKGILVESGAMLDVNTIGLAINVAILEQMMAQDQVIFVLWNLSLTDFIEIVDIFGSTPNFPRTVFETIPIISDTLGGGNLVVPVAFSEAMVAVDTASQVWTALGSLSESMHGTDALSVLGVFSGPLLEQMQALDVPVGSVATAVSLLEQATMVDSMGGTAVRFIYGNTRYWVPPPLF